MGVKPHLLLSLGCHTKQMGDECRLCYDISMFHAAHLSLPHHIHRKVELPVNPAFVAGN